MAIVVKICCPLVASEIAVCENSAQCVKMSLHFLTVLYTVTMFWPVLKISLSTKHGIHKDLQKLRKVILDG